MSLGPTEYIQPSNKDQNLNDEIINAINKLGYKKEEIVKKLKDPHSHISLLYKKLQDENKFNSKK